MSDEDHAEADGSDARRSEEWLARWQEGRTAWHREEINPALQAHLGSWTRVLVPLCGASRDLAWLSDRGIDVVGVELAELACRRLFEQWGREPTVDTVSAAGQSYARYRAERVTVLQGDMLALEPAHAGVHDAVWDRGSLVALEPSLRPAYVAALSRVAAGGQLLLVSFLYDDGVMSGPPYSVSDEYVRETFDEVELLGEQSMAEIAQERGLTTEGDGSLVQRVYRARIRAL